MYAAHTRSPATQNIANDEYRHDWQSYLHIYIYIYIYNIVHVYDDATSEPMHRRIDQMNKCEQKTTHEAMP